MADKIGYVIWGVQDPAAGQDINLVGTRPTGLNDGGVIVGYYQDTNKRYHGFIDNDGAYSSIDDPSAAASGLGTFAIEINDAGQIVGYYYGSGGRSLGFVDHNGAFTTLSVPAGICYLGSGNSLCC